MNFFDNKSILITGGTGSFGRKFASRVLAAANPRRVIIFSRDELKQFEMREEFPEVHGSPIRYFIGDVRDRERLDRAFSNVDIVVHAAALKQVPACEYNPNEAILTNVDGTRNVIDAALDQGVSHVLGVSTDKAVSPTNLYGATKLCAEKILVQANAYSGSGPTRFSCSRYGNVISSRGSVVPLFMQQRKTGKVTVTDERMTRFWITLDQGVDFVMKCLETMHGGEIFIPKIPSINIMDVVAAIAPGCEVDFTGIRSGEKLHEVLLSEDEARTTVEYDDMFVVQPAHSWWDPEAFPGAPNVAEGYSYVSDTNPHYLTKDELLELVSEQ